MAARVILKDATYSDGGLATRRPPKFTMKSRSGVFPETEHGNITFETRLPDDTHNIPDPCHRGRHVHTSGHDTQFAYQNVRSGFLAGNECGLQH